MQGQTGLLKSTPKLTRINGDDALALIYRNMGNNHAYPFVWSETITVASAGVVGAETVPVGAENSTYNGGTTGIVVGFSVTPS